MDQASDVDIPLSWSLLFPKHASMHRKAAHVWDIHQSDAVPQNMYGQHPTAGPDIK